MEGGEEEVDLRKVVREGVCGTETQGRLVGEQTFSSSSSRVRVRLRSLVGIWVDLPIEASKSALFLLCLFS